MVPSTEINSSRSIFFDNIKGLLIFLVVLGHCFFGFQNRPYIGLFVLAIYYVHMPAFIFVSGYFSKSKNSRSKERIIKYIIAYLLVISIYIFQDICLGKEPHILSTYHSEWYLIALVIMRLIVPYFKQNKWVIFELFCFAILAGYWKDLGGNTVLSINKISAFIPFFFVGYFVNSDMISSLRKNGIKTKLVGFLYFAFTVFEIYLSCKYLHITRVDVLPQAYSGASILYAIKRSVIFMTASAFTVALLMLSPNSIIPFLTKAGKNSFSIFIIHRPLTLIFEKIFETSSTFDLVMSSIVFTILSITILGSDFISKTLNDFLSFLTDSINGKCQNQFCKKAIAFFLTILLAVPPIVRIYKYYYSSPVYSSDNQSSDYKRNTDNNYPVLSNNKKERFEGAFRLLFCGDLILLEDQVRNAYTGNGYDFYSNFEYTKKYISSADFAIGVFEGPLGGTEHNYSSSNYRDGKKLYLNFPDEWADAVKDAGFDLVTLANNHILDMGEQGKDRTIDILRNKNMEFIGAYKDAKEKNENRVKVMEVDGIRFAFLSYTEFINGYSKSDLVNGTVSNTTNIILSPSDPEYEKILTDVRNDFKRARELKVDFIIVIPHWGTQFEDEPDDFQLIWQKTFVELGADIILGDHTHSVQPVSIGKNNVFTLYCPGNYANIYREFNGDCNALVEVYIDRSEKKVIGGAIIPMWTTSSLVGNYRPIPIYTILTDKEAGKAITTFDLDRVNDVLKHITNTMLGREIDISLPQERYYFDVDGFMRTKAESIEINDKMKSGVVWSLLSSSKRICFVGDSITRGSKNGGIPWYEPLESSLTGEIINCSWGGATTKDLLNEHLNEIIEAKADLYVIAIGTNDVRYRSEKCALNSTEYVNNLQKIRNAIISLKPDTKFIFIAPWTSTDGDRISKLSYKDKIAMNNEYSSALKKWAESNGDVYVNANEYIDKYLNLYPQSKYLVDFIHPNYLRGIGLYSTSFLSVTSSNKE